VLTPLNITVIRLVPDGIPVKSILVPLVLAYAVAELITPTVARFEPSNVIDMIRLSRL